jgi:hypothetical protein
METFHWDARTGRPTGFQYKYGKIKQACSVVAWDAARQARAQS